MDLKKLLTCGMAAAAVLTLDLSAAEQQESGLAPQKIALLIADVGTIDTVAKTEEYLTKIKEFNTDTFPQLKPGAKISDPALAKGATREEYFFEINRYKQQDREIAARNRRMERVYEQLRNSILRDNREVVVAKDFLQSYLQPYSDFISIIDRSNSSIAEVEKAIGGKDQVDVATSTYFLTVVLLDQKEESNTVQVGNTMVKKTVYTRKAVAKVRDYNGNVLFAINVKGSSSFRRTSASKNVGHDPTSDMMEDLLKQIADKVAAYFTSTLTVKAIGPRNDEEFNPDAVVLYLDGKEFENGGRAITGNHSLLAECDGYKPVVRPITLTSKGRTVKIVFRKVPPPPAPAPQPTVEAAPQKPAEATAK